MDIQVKRTVSPPFLIGWFSIGVVFCLVSALFTFFLSCSFGGNESTDNNRLAGHKIKQDLDKWGHQEWAKWKNRVFGFSYVEACEFSCGGAKHKIVIVVNDKTCLEFCLVPAGTFIMGLSSSKSRRILHESPARKVIMSSFLICRTEVTQRAWELGGSNVFQVDEHPDLPISGVSWNTAVSWCKSLGLSLPSEAQWEYACRAGTNTNFCFGNYPKSLTDYGWYKGNSSNHIQQVGQKKPNAFGLFDMHGNLNELCQDNWHDTYSGAPSNGFPWLGTSKARVVRGGSVTSGANYCSSVARNALLVDYSAEYQGFRPVKLLSTSENRVGR